MGSVNKFITIKFTVDEIETTLHGRTNYKTLQSINTNSKAIIIKTRC